MDEKDVSFAKPGREVCERFERLVKRPVILEARDVTKVFDSTSGSVVALKDVSFTVYEREFHCIIGPSGCGKSTMVRIMAGLETATSGEVLIGGEPITGPGRDRGMVFQSYTLFPWLSVKDNVMFGPRVSGISPVVAEREARQWIELVGLSKFEGAYPHQLSGGMKQRVAIARALANQPKVLFMDEPFGALDAQTRSEMQSYLLDIWRNVDITVVFITHDLDEAVFLADRILILDSHPGRFREMVEVPVERPRRHEQIFEPIFVDTRRHIEEVIHPPSKEKKSAPMMKMSKPHPDVF